MSTLRLLVNTITSCYVIANSSHLTFKAYQTYIMSNTVSLYQTYKLIPCFWTCEGSLTAKEISARLFEIPSHVHGIDLGMHTNYSLGTRIEHGININKNAQLWIESLCLLCGILTTDDLLSVTMVATKQVRKLKCLIFLLREIGTILIYIRNILAQIYNRWDRSYQCDISHLDVRLFLLSSRRLYRLCFTWAPVMTAWVPPVYQPKTRRATVNIPCCILVLTLNTLIL